MEQLFGLILFGIWVFAIVDVLMSDKDAVRSLNKWAWLAIVVLLFPSLPIGAAAWFYAGRPNRLFSGERVPYQRVPRPERRPRREAVEDEVDIEARIAERDRLLAQWEEEDRRKREGGGA